MPEAKGNADPEANTGADNTANQMNEGVEDSGLDNLNVDEIDDVEDLRKNLRSAIGQKKHWRDKHERLASDPRLKEEANKPEPKKPSPKKGDFDPDAVRESIVDEARQEALVVVKYPDLTDDELARAKTLAKADGKKLMEVIQDKYFQAYLAKNVEERAEDRARPNPSNRSGSSARYTTSDLDDPEKLRKMSDADFKKLSDERAAEARQTSRVTHRT